jgi:hypothetical protein
MASKTESASRLSSPFDDAVATFNDTVKAGVKVQEEIGKWWSDALGQAGGGGEQWQKQSKAVFAEAIPAAQKNAEEWLKLVEQNYKRSLALFKKAWDVQPADAGEMRAKSLELWEASLELIRDNAQAMAQTNVKMMEVWGRVMRQAPNGKGK